MVLSDFNGYLWGNSMDSKEFEGIQSDFNESLWKLCHFKAFKVFNGCLVGVFKKSKSWIQN